MVVDFILEAGVVLAKIFGTILLLASCVAIYRVESARSTDELCE